MELNRAGTTSVAKPPQTVNSSGCLSLRVPVCVCACACVFHPQKHLFK